MQDLFLALGALILIVALVYDNRHHIKHDSFDE